jgi:hypothetical protein
MTQPVEKLQMVEVSRRADSLLNVTEVWSFVMLSETILRRVCGKMRGRKAQNDPLTMVVLLLLS